MKDLFGQKTWPRIILDAHLEPFWAHRGAREMTLQEHRRGFELARELNSDVPYSRVKICFEGTLERWTHASQDVLRIAVRVARKHFNKYTDISNRRLADQQFTPTQIRDVQRALYRTTLRLLAERSVKARARRAEQFALFSSDPGS